MTKLRTLSKLDPEADKRAPEELIRSESTWGLAWKRFRRHKLALLGGTVIAVFLFIAVFAPFLTPYDFSRQNRRLGFSAPNLTVATDPGDLRLRDKCARPQVLFWKCTVHPFGTDDLGRDVLTRVMHGARVSLLVGFVAAITATLIGSLLGAFAAYWSGYLDAVISRFIDIMLSIPQLPLLLILVGLLNSSEVAFTTFLNEVLGQSKSIAVIILVIISLSWMGVARLVRGEVLSLREREFIEAARAIGLSNLRIVTRHLVPNASHVIIVQATLLIGEAILIESGLSFLGLGIQPPAVSWGNMLSRAQEFLYWPNGIYSALFPGLFIFLTVLCFNFLGDGLRDALDPRAKQ
jgi:peptide/nickel transport system permease protein